MPNSVKKFLDQTGTGYLWSKIKQQLDNKANAVDLTALETRVGTLEQSPGYDDTVIDGRVTAVETALAGKASQSDLNTVDGKVTTLIGSDTNKSVRTIANEELAAQLIAANADESLDTLQEIAAWIQSHPNDASAMSAAITALQTKTELGTYDDNGTPTQYATVKAYVEGYVGAAVAAVHSHDNKAVLDTITSTLVSNWNTAYTNNHTHSNKSVLDGITAADIAAWNAAEQNAKSYAVGLAANYATAAQGALADTALQATDVIGLTSAEIDAAIASANSNSGSNSGSGSESNSEPGSGD